MFDRNRPGLDDFDRRFELLRDRIDEDFKHARRIAHRLGIVALIGSLIFYGLLIFACCAGAYVL